MSANLPNKMKRIQIYLPQNAEFTAKALKIDDGADFIFLKNKRPKWITYGSSITKCLEAESPAIAASNLFYINSLEIFGEIYADLLPDQLHPNAEGYKIMAKHFLDIFANLYLS